MQEYITLVFYQNNHIDIKYKVIDNTMPDALMNDIQQATEEELRIF